MIQTQILLTNIIRVVWETEKRITYEILGVKGLKTLSYFFMFLPTWKIIDNPSGGNALMTNWTQTQHKCQL